MCPFCAFILTSFAFHFHCNVFFRFWLMHWLLCHWMDTCIMAEGVWQSGEGDPSYTRYLHFSGCQPVSNCCHAHPTWDWILKSLTAMEINWRHLFMCMFVFCIPKLAVCQADLSLRPGSGRSQERTGSSPESLYDATESHLRAWKCWRILIKVIVSSDPWLNKAVIFLYYSPQKQRPSL